MLARDPLVNPFTADDVLVGRGEQTYRQTISFPRWNMYNDLTLPQFFNFLDTFVKFWANFSNFGLNFQFLGTFFIFWVTFFKFETLNLNSQNKPCYLCPKVSQNSYLFPDENPRFVRFIHPWSFMCISKKIIYLLTCLNFKFVFIFNPLKFNTKFEVSRYKKAEIFNKSK